MVRALLCGSVAHIDLRVWLNHKLWVPVPGLKS
jgi:hypothetical protein